MFKRRPQVEKQFISGKSTRDVPEAIQLASFKKEPPLAAYTGPNTGLRVLDTDTEISTSDQCVAGVNDWNNPSDYAYGLSVSLYETDKRCNRQVGGPVADVFGVVVRENNAIMAIADGSGWGKKARLAARCAVNGAIAHITDNLHKLSVKKPTSATLNKLLHESMDIAHKSILSHGGTLTTLSIAVACELSAPSNQWGLFVASVGDSPVFVYCPHTYQLHEATVDCHSKDGNRVVQLSGGALGPAIGTLPDLDNFSMSYSPVYPGDIVLLMTDGVYDNFAPGVVQAVHDERALDCDSGVSFTPPNASPVPGPNEGSSSPVLNRQTCCPSPSNPHTTERPWPPCDVDLHRSISSAHPPSSVYAEEDTQLIELKKCCESLPEMMKFLHQHQANLCGNMTAQTVSSAIINFVYEATEKKRIFKSDCLEKDINVSRRRRADPEFASELQSHKSKLDHATIVSYCIGTH
ncbi:PREDICTED: PP2C-like domain-containing protein CG9801 [Amphimedon queenslandica]|uniref:PPM-type phosphatase domain-containing protein n=1 Tax=Amphimedon queenslandica TaxID=400682 RepID=A0A1X7UGS7_AMPQE|nr:PREDICTED: PP2C-like domain-containing protein CG9801 [Amphimedon queenslandica]|eukprot:XP_019854264.1 PREDICTED: PP2C-like domain-containing protein CG9801 [Amphimedon queenslandica]